MVRPPQPAHQVALQSLRDWLRSSGALLNLRINANSPNSRSLHATTLVPESTPVLRIPPTHLITSQIAAQTYPIPDIMRAAREAKLHERLPDAVGDNAHLLLFVMLQLANARSSFYAPWLRSLPAVFHTAFSLPFERVKDLLYDTPVFPLIVKLREELLEMFHDWFLPFAARPYPQCFPPEVCTFELFQYAHCVIETRAFRIDSLTLLAPFADMANHAPTDSNACNAKVRGYAFEDDTSRIGLEMYATRDIPIDEQVCISYGKLKNWELLLHYGFALLHNPSDGIDVSLQSPEETVVATTLILHLALGYTDMDFTLTLADPLPKEMLISLRIMLLDDSERSRAASTDFTVSVTHRNERQVISYLRTLLEALDIPRVFEGAHDDFTKFCAHYITSHMQILDACTKRVDDMERAVAQQEQDTTAAAPGAASNTDSATGTSDPSLPNHFPPNSR
ncbi:SET domain containing protein [Gracilaria domingensis]|nr:SET domain containing protein [Gracilaria domingensis]